MFVKLQQTCDRDVCAKFYDAAAELTDGKKPSPKAQSKPYSIISIDRYFISRLLDFTKSTENIYNLYPYRKYGYRYRYFYI